MISRARWAVLFPLSGIVLMVAAVPAHAQNAPRGAAPSANADTSAPSDKRASAYYYYSLGHLYAQQAAAFGGRAQYVNMAVDYFKQALAADPSSAFIGEELAKFYIQAGQSDKAVDLANQMIKTNPDSAGPHRILARIYSEQLDPSQGKVDPEMLRNAISQFQQVQKFDPKDSESLTTLAGLYMMNKQPAEAEQTYQAVLAIDGGDEDALSGLASLLAGKGDIAGAIELLKRAAESSSNPELTGRLAELYEQDGDFASAAEQWKKVLPVANGTAIRRRYAEALKRANKVDDAIKAYQELTAVEPKVVENHLELVDLWARKHNYDNAHSELEKARAIENSTTVRLAEAELLDAEGKSAEAVTSLASLLNDTKKTVYSDAERTERIETLRTVAGLQRSTGKTADSVASLRQIADLNPAAAAAVEIEVVETYATNRDFTQARQAADAALRKFSDDPRVRMAHASLLGDLGQFDAAIAELKAMPNSDKDRDVLVAIAQVQEKAKRFADGRSTIDKAEALSKTDQDKRNLAFMRGALYEREKNYDAAEAQFRKVLDGDPANASALNYLGYMLADRGVRLDEAQQLISKALDLEPDNGAFMDSLGWVHYQQNHLDQAAMELNHALDLIGKESAQHKDPAVLDHLGDVYFKQGKLKEAIQQWEESVAEMKSSAPGELDPDDLTKISKKLSDAKAKVK